MSGWSTSILLTLITLVYLVLCIGFFIKCFVSVCNKPAGLPKSDDPSPFGPSHLDDDEPLLDPSADNLQSDDMSDHTSFPPYNLGSRS